MFLRPLDEVGNDEEVARIFHSRDDAELEVEPFAIFIDGVRRRDARGFEAALEPLLRALAQFARLVGRRAAIADRETRKDRLMRAGSECAALRDLDGRGGRLGHIGEQRNHLGAALEAMLGRQLATVAVRKQPAFGNADQRVVCFVILRRCEISLVGGDERHAFAVGEIDQHRLGAALIRRAVAL